MGCSHSDKCMVGVSRPSEFNRSPTVAHTLDKLYWRDASLNTLDKLYWRDASLNTLDCHMNVGVAQTVTAVVIAGFKDGSNW